MVHIFSNVKNRVWAISNLKSYTNLLKIMNKCVIIYILFKINYQQKNGLITAHAVFDSYCKRNNDAIITENIVRGWDKHEHLFGGIWDIEIKFTNFIDLRINKFLNK